MTETNYTYFLETDDGIRIADQITDLPPTNNDWTANQVTAKPTILE